MSEDRDAPIDDDLIEDQDLDTEQPEDDLEDELPEEDLEPVDDEAEAEPEPPPARGASRFQALSERARAAEQRAEAAERRAEEALRRTNTEAFQAQERERLEQMSPEERVEYRVNQRLAGIEFRTWDTNDRVTFDGLINRNPAVAAIKDEVEQVFQERMKQGAAVDRTTIATYLIGQKALSKAPRAKAAGARAAAAGRDRNTVRPPASRGDSAPAGRKSASEAEARRKRLEGLEI